MNRIIWALKCKNTFLSNSEGSFETAQCQVIFILVTFSSKEGSDEPAQIRESIKFPSHIHMAPDKSTYWKTFLYFSSKTYVEGTQKIRLNETVLLSTQNTCLN